MATCAEEFYRERFVFSVFGGRDHETQINKFMMAEFDDRRSKKLVALLAAINSDPLMYCHSEKFKLLHAPLWEMKIHQVRIACVWDPKPQVLVAVYGLIKKQDRWPNRDLENALAQLNRYLACKQDGRKGVNHGRTRKSQISH